MSKTHLTWGDIDKRLVALASRLSRAHNSPTAIRIYGVPRGGAIVAGLLRGVGRIWEGEDCPRFLIVSGPEDAHVIIDDMIDSGETMQRHLTLYGKPFDALLPEPVYADGKKLWVVFPWEGTDPTSDVHSGITRLLQFIGEDPTRDGLLETPKRFVKAFAEMTAGYKEDPGAHLEKIFDMGEHEYDQMILSGGIPFVSLCEHHLSPFYGHAHIAYIPGDKGKVVGLSKLARVVDGYSKRLQVQERLTTQVRDTITKHLNPAGVAVLIKGTHTCQCWRGVKKDGYMITSSLQGVFKDDPRTRAEFMQMLSL